MPTPTSGSTTSITTTLYATLCLQAIVMTSPSNKNFYYAPVGQSGRIFEGSMNNPAGLNNGGSLVLSYDTYYTGDTKYQSGSITYTLSYYTFV